MLITRLPAASLGWRAFAVLVTVSAGPLLITSLGVSGSSIARNSCFGIVALTGLLGYAYGFRIGPLLFWRFFAVVFTVGLVIRAGVDLGPTAMAVTKGDLAPGSSRVVAGAVLIVAFALLCLALLGHAQLVGRDRPQVDRNAELADIFA